MIRFSKIATAAALAAAFAGSSTLALAADPIKIGVAGPFTGGSSSMGVSMRDGVRLAIDEINKSGGVLGRQFVAVERDDEAKNERGVQIAQELINKEKVTATVGYINTGVALASQRFFQEAKIPVMNNVATGSVITHQFDKEPENYIFRNAAHDSIQAPMIVEEAITRRHFKKVAILADSTNYGQLGRQDLETALKAKGVTPVAVEKFNIKDVDMTAQLLKAKEAGAEAVLTYGIGPELAQIANGMTKLGWKVPMVGSWTLSMANFIDNAGPGGDGARMPQTFIQEPTTPKRKAFIASYLGTFKPKNNRIDSPVSAAQVQRAERGTRTLAVALPVPGGTRLTIAADGTTPSATIDPSASAPTSADCRVQPALPVLGSIPTVRPSGAVASSRFITMCPNRA